MKLSISVLVLSVAAALPCPAHAGPASCESLATLVLPGTTISVAAVVPAGGFDPPGPTPPIDTAACRVAGTLKPTSDSEIKFEVWMPIAGWNGKFLSAGEGGYAGAINYGGIAAALGRGYAGGSTDTGHAGGTADFAPGHPDKVIDFGWRAKHLQAARSKNLIRAFYGKRIKHSYFSSCSNGGRQALMEVQRFPDDYDGVLVGAPAHDWTHLFAGFVWNEQALWNTPGAYVSASKLAAIQAATLATCDGLDGVRDGVVEDPRRCRFDPASLACPAGSDGASCLTPPQVTAIHKIMTGARNPRTGRQIFPGWFTSAAGEPAAWPLWITGPATPGASVQAFFGNGFFGRIVEQIPAPGVWDFTTFNFASDMAVADVKTERTFNATDPELSAFTRHNRHGKIIVWHGWEDPAISASSSVDYFREVVRSNEDSRDFFRMFMVPGMLHCGGGPGPNAFGQSLPQGTPLSNAPGDDILSALEQWVERGVAPEQIVAVKYVNDQPAQGVLRTRPLCAFPNTAVYKGTGSTDDAASFECRRPRHEQHGRGDDD
ncbi:MAG TPA: tannase/feruloyl esterase family alpha/beta hydrolase [Kofleriaceae bacterium]|nr:tannase/feruloyl esterase family alpha/beta hydrolase [Kofleriaceae bacterium]